MPTYDYRCRTCGREESVFQTIGQYISFPIRPPCCGFMPMERKLSVVPAMSGLANALAGDRHYDGLVAPDGTDISTRTKHRQYMKDHGLSLADDFKETWRKAEKERQAFRAGEHRDPELRATVTELVTKAVNQQE